MTRLPDSVSHARFHRAARIPALTLLVTAACASPGPAPTGSPPHPAGPDTYVDASGSFLPNLGAGLGIGRVLRRSPEGSRSLEVDLTYQFLDDEDFVDDDNPKAGPWYQLRAGLRDASAPDRPRHTTTRLGAVWLRAEGEPNVIQEGGDYLGLYGGIGVEADLLPRLAVGPEVTVLLITRTTKLSVARPVPQINWHATLKLGHGGGSSAPAERPQPGELSLGASAMVSPGLGGELEVGQVLRESPGVTWSFEVLAALQSPGDALFFEGDGRWAQARAGLKAAFQPSARGHWTVRGGVVWLRSTAPNRFLDHVLSDYIGPYGGVGWEYDLTTRLSTGPEMNLMLVGSEGTGRFGLVPQLLWHVSVGL